MKFNTLIFFIFAATFKQKHFTMKTEIYSTSVGKGENIMNKEFQLYQSEGTSIKGVLQIDTTSRILIIRGVPVLLDRDLAELYTVDTKRINEQVRRNIERFPERFRFQLSDDETRELVANCDRLEKLKHSSVNPYAFTEQGTAMLATVLKSDVAIKVSIAIMDAFVEMHKIMVSNASLFQRINDIERHQLCTDQKINEIIDFIGSNALPPKEGIFYDGQIFDAYAFASELIKSAKKRIVLIDNYIDESVLLMLAKRNEGVSAEIVTKQISETLTLDIERHNRQYPHINIRESPRYHDRFLIIDDTVYHIGASLKDLGKKLFAFSRMEIDMREVGI